MSAIEEYAKKHGKYPRTKATSLQLKLLREVKAYGARTFAGRAALTDAVLIYRFVRYDRFAVLMSAGWIEVKKADGFCTWWQISPLGEEVLALYYQEQS